MKRIILTQNNADILGSDGLMYIDGRLNMQSVKQKVNERNARFTKNFPHKIADGFYFAGERLSRISQIYSI
jgi:hypothetical protein